MKKFLLSLIFLGMLYSAASADIVYTTANGYLGRITVNSSSDIQSPSTQVYNNDKPNSIIVSYWENRTTNNSGTSKLLLVTPVDSSSTEYSGDIAVVYDSKLERADDAETYYLAGTYGASIIEGTDPGRSFYAVSGASVREYSTINFNATGRKYTCPSTDLMPNPEIRGLAVQQNQYYQGVHILVHRDPASGDAVLNFDGQLSSNFSSELPISKDREAYSIALLEKGFAVGHDKGVIWVESGNTSSDVVTGTSAPVIAICRDNSNGFYYAVSGDAIYHYDSSSTTPVTVDDTLAAGSVKFIRDSDHKLLVAMNGGGINFYSMENNSKLKSFPSNTLFGNAVSITTATTTGNSAKSGGGCGVIGCGSIIILAGLGLLRKKGVRTL